MPHAGMVRPLASWLVAGCLLGLAVPGRAASGQEPPGLEAPRPLDDDNAPPERPARPRVSLNRADVKLPPSPPSILPAEYVPIDLTTALRTAGVQNPELMLARARVLEAVALRQLAVAQLLPTLNGGTNYDNHTGVLQQSNGNILTVNRAALYVGSGANAIAAGSVNIPGVVLAGNIAQGVYGFLTSRQIVRAREFGAIAVRNQAFLETCLAYSELLRAEGERAVAMQVRDENREVVYYTTAYADVGVMRPADANRALTELASREAEVQAAEGRVLSASARLAQAINVDPSIRFHPTDAWVVPAPIVPDPIPVRELIAIALLNRPELAERRAEIRAALLQLEGAKALPFSPTILIGFSAGGFGGGSNLVSPTFGGFGGRSDFDALAYWSLQNMGIGNLALINTARAQERIAEFRWIAVMDRVRAEVAESYARTHARYAQIGSTESAVRSGVRGFSQDLMRARDGVGLPIEVLDNLRLLARARFEYLDSIVDYNEAQFELYVALGQPPANVLAHPVPTAGVVPRGEPVPNRPVPPSEGPARAPAPRDIPETAADAVPPPPVASTIPPPRTPTVRRAADTRPGG